MKRCGGLHVLLPAGHTNRMSKICPKQPKAHLYPVLARQTRGRNGCTGATSLGLLLEPGNEVVAVLVLLQTSERHLCARDILERTTLTTTS